MNEVDKLQKKPSNRPTSKFGRTNKVNLKYSVEHSHSNRPRPSRTWVDLAHVSVSHSNDEVVAQSRIPDNVNAIRPLGKVNGSLHIRSTISFRRCMRACRRSI